MAQEGRDEKGKFSTGAQFWRQVEQNGGMPPTYSDPIEMCKKIGEYLDKEDSLKRPDSYSKAGKGLYTLSGCAYHLGFASRQSMYDYEKKSPTFSYVIKRFRLFLTDWNEKKLYYMGTFPGSKLWLTNFGDYSEESTVNQNVTEFKTKWAEGDK